jgi:hypothetical protein
MADNRKAADEAPLDAGKAARAAVQETEPADDAPTFTLDRLTGSDGASLTGYPSHVVAGALAGVTKKKFTIEETKAAVHAWLDAPVKEG